MQVIRHAVGLAALLAALVLPASAPAQSGDPAQGSPSGVIYEIPLDDARRDAAPSGRRGSGGGAAGDGSPAGAGPVSPIRSENGFGSSSTVPGTDAADSRGAGEDRGGSAGDSGGSGGSGSGSGGQGSGGDANASGGGSLEALRGSGSATITPSKSRAYLLLALALVVAGGLGVAGRYVARRR